MLRCGVPSTSSDRNQRTLPGRAVKALAGAVAAEGTVEDAEQPPGSMMPPFAKASPAPAETVIRTGVLGDVVKATGSDRMRAPGRTMTPGFPANVSAMLLPGETVRDSGAEGRAMLAPRIV